MENTQQASIIPANDKKVRSERISILVLVYLIIIGFFLHWTGYLFENVHSNLLEDIFFVGSLFPAVSIIGIVVSLSVLLRQKNTSNKKPARTLLIISILALALLFIATVLLFILNSPRFGHAW